MHEGKIWWHPAFAAALKVELNDYEKSLTYYEEFPLSEKPLQIDIIVLKKVKSIPIHKEIGHLFRGHNIIEYKSPDDYLNINDFYKTYGYACFYQANTKKVMEINPEEITITLVCSHCPKKLFSHLMQVRGIKIQEYAPGIYHLYGSPYLFPMQVIIISELSPKEYFWMQHLRTNLKSGGEIQELVEAYEDKKNINLYQTIMDAIVRSNPEEMEEEKKMCQALRELFADEFEECKEKAISEGLQQGIQQGIRQGIQQGELNSLHTNILDFLKDLGTLSPNLQEKIQSVQDINILKQWLKLAARADSIEDFIEKIN